MSGALLTRYVSHGVTLLGDVTRPGGVTFAFTERSGGVSRDSYSSLNLGDRCGDDSAAVAENRRRALQALGAAALEHRLVNPMQVHGDHVVVVRDGSDEGVRAAQREAQSGADAVVCTATDVPVLLCFADCVPLVLIADGGFAVVHSGWKGTIAQIGGKALKILCEETSSSPSEVRAYLGPHIMAADYETSPDLIDRFRTVFGDEVCLPECHLDLTAAVTKTLRNSGVDAEKIVVCSDSTAVTTDRFFSYRASHGTCGRHGALAYIPGKL